MKGGGGSVPYSAGEAVAPNAMSPTEFSSIPGAQGGEVAAGGGSSVDWGKVFAGFNNGMKSAPSQLASPFGQSGSESWPTLASPIQFQTVAQFLASLQGKGGKR